MGKLNANKAIRVNLCSQEEAIPAVERVSNVRYKELQNSQTASRPYQPNLKGFVFTLWPALLT